jgi:hypothetical protein
MSKALTSIYPLRPLRGAPPPNSTSLYLVDRISFHVEFGGSGWGWVLPNLLNHLFGRRYDFLKAS